MIDNIANSGEFPHSYDTKKWSWFSWWENKENLLNGWKSSPFVIQKYLDDSQYLMFVEVIKESMDPVIQELIS